MLYPECKKLYGPYTRKDGRKHVVLVFNDNTKKTVSYPKILMEYHLDRYLKSDETVDHIDGDFTNDEKENLRVINRSQHVREDVKRLIDQEFKCPYCNKSFNLSGSKLSNAISNRKRGKFGPFCSRTCAGKYSTSIQHRGKKIEKPSQIIPEYTNLKSSGASQEKSWE